MPWPFRRARPSDDDAGLDSAGPGSDRTDSVSVPVVPGRPQDAWRGLAPIEPVVTATLANPSVEDPAAFVRTLPSRWQQSPTLAPLGHDVRPEAMGGLVGGLVSVAAEPTTPAGDPPTLDLRLRSLPLVPGAAEGPGSNDSDERSVARPFTSSPLIGPAAPVVSRPTAEVTGVSPVDPRSSASQNPSAPSGATPEATPAGSPAAEPTDDPNAGPRPTGSTPETAGTVPAPTVAGPEQRAVALPEIAAAADGADEVERRPLTGLADTVTRNGPVASRPPVSLTETGLPATTAPLPAALPPVTPDATAIPAVAAASGGTTPAPGTSPNQVDAESAEGATDAGAAAGPEADAPSEGSGAGSASLEATSPDQDGGADPDGAEDAIAPPATRRRGRLGAPINRPSTDEAAIDQAESDVPAAVSSGADALAALATADGPTAVAPLSAQRSLAPTQRTLASRRLSSARAAALSSDAGPAAAEGAEGAADSAESASSGVDAGDAGDDAAAGPDRGQATARTNAPLPPLLVSPRPPAMLGAAGSTLTRTLAPVLAAMPATADALDAGGSARPAPGPGDAPAGGGAAAGAAAASGGGAAASTPDTHDAASLDRLAHQLYGRLRSQLASELLVGRERAQLLTDL